MNFDCHVRCVQEALRIIRNHMIINLDDKKVAMLDRSLLDLVLPCVSIYSVRELGSEFVISLQVGNRFYWGFGKTKEDGLFSALVKAAKFAIPKQMATFVPPNVEPKVAQLPPIEEEIQPESTGEEIPVHVEEEEKIQQPFRRNQGRNLVTRPFTLAERLLKMNRLQNMVEIPSNVDHMPYRHPSEMLYCQFGLKVSFQTEFDTKSRSFKSVAEVNGKKFLGEASSKFRAEFMAADEALQRHLGLEEKFGRKVPNNQKENQESKTANEPPKREENSPIRFPGEDPIEKLQKRLREQMRFSFEGSHKIDDVWIRTLAIEFNGHKFIGSDCNMEVAKRKAALEALDYLEKKKEVLDQATDLREILNKPKQEAMKTPINLSDSNKENVEPNHQNSSLVEPEEIEKFEAIERNISPFPSSDEETPKIRTIYRSKFGEMIQNLVLDKFQTLAESSNILRKNDILAGIVMTQIGAEPKVIGLAKVKNLIPPTTSSNDDDTLRNCHAEALIRRCFVRFLYNNLHCLAESSAGTIFEIVEVFKFAVKPDVNFHLYISGGLFDEAKLRRWTVLGLQGALLSQILRPIFLSSLTIGAELIGKQKNPFDEKLKGHHELSVHIVKRENRAPQVENSCFAFVWTANDETLSVLSTYTGKSVDGNCLISRKSFYKCFIDTLDTLFDSNPGTLMYTHKDYEEAKNSAVEYQTKKKHFKKSITYN